jgi:hypothetical protein
LVIISSFFNNSNNGYDHIRDPSTVRRVPGSIPNVTTNLEIIEIYLTIYQFNGNQSAENGSVAKPLKCREYNI